MINCLVICNHMNNTLLRVNSFSKFDFRSRKMALFNNWEWFLSDLKGKLLTFECDGPMISCMDLAVM